MSADYYYKPVFNYYRKKKQMYTLSTKGVYMVTQWIPNGHPMDTQCLIFVRQDIQDSSDSSDMSIVSIVSVK